MVGVDFGGNKFSKRSKRINNPRFQKERVNAVEKAHQLMEAMGQDAAYKLADYQVTSLKRVIEEGAPLERVFTGKDIRRNMGFWLSVRGYLNRKPRDMRKVS